MKELKKVFDFVKEQYKNPRTRAAVILGIYFVFFVFLFIGLNSANSTSTINGENIQNYNNISENYNYAYNIEIENSDHTDKYLFTGLYNEGNTTQKMTLYNNETGEYEEILEYTNINPKFLDLKTIISYVNNIKEEFSTNYKDGTIQKNYLVELNKIDENVNSEKTVEINVYEKDNFITKIIIDGTNFDVETNEGVVSSKYTLEFEPIKDQENAEE